MPTGYDAEAHRDLCRSYGTEPRLHKRGQPHGSGLGKRRWPVERANAWLLENKRLGLRYDRLGFVVESLLQAACIFLVAPRLLGHWRRAHAFARQSTYIDSRTLFSRSSARRAAGRSIRRSFMAARLVSSPIGRPNSRPQG